MSKNTSISIIIAIIVIIIGVAIYFQSTDTSATPSAVILPTTSGSVTNNSTGTNAPVATTPGATTIGGTAGTNSPKSTSSPAVSVGTSGYVDYTMHAGESINVSGYTILLVSLGSTEVNMKVTKSYVATNQTFVLKNPHTVSNFTGELLKINADKSISFRVTILP